MSWKDIIKNEDFDWDKEMKNIFDNMKDALSDDYQIRAQALENMANSLHELEYFYEKNKEKMQ